MIDACYRLAYRVGYRAVRQIWRIHRPRHRGALVAIWHDGGLCLVRPSYRPTWELPGGGAKAGEPAIDAARRELREELGLDLPEASFVMSFETEHDRDYRRDHVTVFDVVLTERPDIVTDNREIIDARFFTPDEARTRRLPRYLLYYLHMRDQAVEGQ
jgi:ADP-ribose pyrophosphatase YjhB (NUDIX family)